MNPQTKTSAKDFFIHLGVTITLYISVIALINLAYSIIDYLLPDALNNYFSTTSIAWPISTLVVLVPVFYILVWILNNDIAIHPEKNDLWIKKWRTFLTLFLAGGVIAGDLIFLINTYLNGEITYRFVWKFFVILIILGIIFAYYLLERIEKAKGFRTVLLYSGIVIVVGTIVYGFIIVGSPSKQRSIRFDEQRVGDLQNIQWQIVSYWQMKSKLPANLANLEDPISGIIIPKDPESKSEYQYIVKGDKTFQICASFNLDSSVSVNVMIYPSISTNENWKHSAGTVCFDRTIDPEKYPPTPNAVKSVIK